MCDKCGGFRPTPSGKMHFYDAVLTNVDHPNLTIYCKLVTDDAETPLDMIVMSEVEVAKFKRENEE